MRGGHAIRGHLGRTCSGICPFHQLLPHGPWATSNNRCRLGDLEALKVIAGALSRTSSRPWQKPRASWVMEKPFRLRANTQPMNPKHKDSTVVRMRCHLTGNVS